MYKILDDNLPEILDDKEEQDARSMLDGSWANLLKESEARQEEFSQKQSLYKKNLIQTVNLFKKDVVEFRKSYEKSGPMVKGIPPREAVERLMITSDSM